MRRRKGAGLIADMMDAEEGSGAGRRVVIPKESKLLSNPRGVVS